MKNLMFILAALLMSIQSEAGVTFTFKSGTIANGQLKAKMERNISNLLTEIQTAGQQRTTPNLANIDMEEGARKRLLAQWKILPFVCENYTNVSACLNDFQGYQVRGIRITLRPHDNTYRQSVRRELTISLNRNGTITGVRPAIETQEDMQKMVDEGKDVSDMAQRLEILKWVEDFRNYYNERDLVSLRNIYSDDALIITGSIVTTRKGGDLKKQMTTNVKYTVQSKERYLTNLSNLFNNVKYIDVQFDHISVIRNGAKPHIYGVTLHQTWKTSGYCDDGWLFLLWDFSDREHPQIHVRSWQSEQVVMKEGVFTIDDFFIP